MEASTPEIVASWNETELERVEQCPLCGSHDRTLLHAQLIDLVFGAPGLWPMYRCGSCQVGYLDPRPTPDSIAKAYATYYTHSEGQEGQPGSFLGRVVQWARLASRNGYLRHRYNVRLQPSLWLGALVVPHLPVSRSKADRKARWLRLPHRGARLLDVGCGNGDFLRQMQQSGWNVAGLDFDAEAVKTCQAIGIAAAQGTIETASFDASSFDAITLSHVIEHLYDPIAVLQQCYTLLKPGGQLYIETPNLNSIGHRRYQNHWRGLEPPRHLILFNVQSLQYVCGRANLLIHKLEGVPSCFLHEFPELGHPRGTGSVRPKQSGSRLSASPCPVEARRSIKRSCS